MTSTPQALLDAESLPRGIDTSGAGHGAYGIVTGTGMEGTIWGAVAAFGAVLIAGFVDIAARVTQSMRLAPASA